MSTDLTLMGSSPFDAIRREDEHGEYWNGRDLQPVMQYSRWEDFATVILKARNSLALVQGDDQAAHHFGKSRSDGGRWGNQPLDDYRLTRFAAYLVAMAGDDTKTAVAEARVYFAVRTREAEVTATPAPLTELEMARNYVAALERLAIAEPKAEAHDAFMDADGDYLVGTVAKMLGVGQNILFRRLRDEKVFISAGRRRNTPYQQYVHHFRVVARIYADGEGDPHPTYTTYVRPSGVEFIRKLLASDGAA